MIDRGREIYREITYTRVEYTVITYKRREGPIIQESITKKRQTKRR